MSDDADTATSVATVLRAQYMGTSDSRDEHHAKNTAQTAVPESVIV
jgi:hypothetical protein